MVKGKGHGGEGGVGGGCSYSRCLGPSEVKSSPWTQKNVNRFLIVPALCECTTSPCLQNTKWNDKSSYILAMVLGAHRYVYGTPFPKVKRTETESCLGTLIRVRMSGAIQPLPLCAFKACTRTILLLSFDRRRHERK
jgi:hypothetical protein